MQRPCRTLRVAWARAGPACLEGTLTASCLVSQCPSCSGSGEWEYWASDLERKDAVGCVYVRDNGRANLCALCSGQPRQIGLYTEAGAVPRLVLRCSLLSGLLFQTNRTGVPRSVRWERGS